MLGHKLPLEQETKGEQKDIKNKEKKKQQKSRSKTKQTTYLPKSPAKNSKGHNLFKSLRKVTNANTKSNETLEAALSRKSA